MTDEEIVKVVSTLVGSIVPIRDSYYDGKALENICLLGNVVDSLICKMGNVALDSYNSSFGSEEQCGKQLFKILKSINQNIEEYLQEATGI